MTSKNRAGSLTTPLTFVTMLNRFLCFAQLAASRFPFAAILVLAVFTSVLAQKGKTTDAMEYDVTMNQPENHVYHLALKQSTQGSATVDLKMPAWTPGIRSGAVVLQLNDNSATLSAIKAHESVKLLVV